MADAEQDQYWIGFDLGGTKMLSIVYDNEWNIVGKKRRRTQGEKGAETGVNRVITTVKKALDEANIQADKLSGIGIGAPGPVDLNDGVVLEAPNLGWRDVPLQRLLEEAIGCPVVLMNDVDAGIYGEYRFGAGQGGHCVLGVFPGTGVGGGCIYDGRIFRGQRLSCMEIGHLEVISLGPRSGTGQQGTVESYASRLAIAASAAQAAYRGQAPAMQELAGADLAKIRSGVIAESIRRGDETVERAVADAAAVLGVTIGGMVHLIAPDIIVLGGGLVEAMPDLMLTEVRKAVQDFVIPSYQGSYKIVPAALGDDATVKGAAAWAQHEITEKRG